METILEIIGEDSYQKENHNTRDLEGGGIYARCKNWRTGTVMWKLITFFQEAQFEINFERILKQHKLCCWRVEAAAAATLDGELWIHSAALFLGYEFVKNSFPPIQTDVSKIKMEEARSYIHKNQIAHLKFKSFECWFTRENEFPKEQLHKGSCYMIKNQMTPLSDQWFCQSYHMRAGVMGHYISSEWKRYCGWPKETGKLTHLSWLLEAAQPGFPPEQT